MRVLHSHFLRQVSIYVTTHNTGQAYHINFPLIIAKQGILTLTLKIICMHASQPTLYTSPYLPISYPPIPTISYCPSHPPILNPQGGQLSVLLKVYQLGRDSTGLRPRYTTYPTPIHPSVLIPYLLITPLPGPDIRICTILYLRSL